MRPIICIVLLAAVASTACKTMRSVALDQVNTLGPERAWVTESDQSVVLMYEPKVVRDTLVGYVGKYKEKMPSGRVNQVRVETPAHTRTAVLVAGITVGLGAFLVLAAGNGQSAVIVSMSGPPGDCEQDPLQPICTGVPEP